MYACGVMFYEMLTGEVPFRGDSWAEVALRHQTDTPVLDRVPPEYLTIIEKALHKKPENRYADMDEMIRAVEVVSRVGPPARHGGAVLVATVIDDKDREEELGRAAATAKANAAAVAAERFVRDAGRGPRLQGAAG